MSDLHKQLRDAGMRRGGQWLTVGIIFLDIASILALVATEISKLAGGLMPFMAIGFAIGFTMSLLGGLEFITSWMDK